MIERVDDMGALVRLEGPARRIVCLVPSITETLFAFGAGASVAGITDYCVHPAGEVRTKNRVGGTKNIMVEKIIALAPDLVIANAEENRKHQVRKLQEAGLQVFVTFPKTIDDCIRMMENVAALCGAEEAAVPILRDIARERTEVRAIAPRPPPAVFCPIWKNPYMTVNRDTFVDAVIREAGGRNIFGDHPDRYPTITLDEVDRGRPDVVILPTEPYRFSEADKDDLLVHCAEVPAVQTRRIYVVEGELMSWYGPRVARALTKLSALFRE